MSGVGYELKQAELAITIRSRNRRWIEIRRLGAVNDEEGMEATV
jgi:hypothetical protein